MIENAYGREKVESPANQAPLNEHWMKQLNDRTKLSPDSFDSVQPDAKSFLPKMELVENQKDVGDSKTGDTKKVVYESNIEEATKKAKEQGKPLIIIFSASDISKEMDRRRDDCRQYQDLADQAVFARVDLDKLPDKERQDLMNKYQIHFAPTTIIQDPVTGEQKSRLLGHSAFPESDAAFMDSIIAGSDHWYGQYIKLAQSVNDSIKTHQVTSETIEKAEQAVKLAADHFGPEHIYTLSMEKTLAQALCETGDEHNLKRAQEILSSVLNKGMNNFDNVQRPANQKIYDARLIMECGINLGNLQAKFGDKSGAVYAYQKALDVLEYLNDPKLKQVKIMLLKKIAELQMPIN